MESARDTEKYPFIEATYVLNVNSIWLLSGAQAGWSKGGWNFVQTWMKYFPIILEYESVHVCKSMPVWFTCSTPVQVASEQEPKDPSET